MTPRYTWTPASEPPKQTHDVWARIGDGEPFKAWFGWMTPKAGYWRDPGSGLVIDGVTHWRDVEPPEAGE